MTVEVWFDSKRGTRRFELLPIRTRKMTTTNVSHWDSHPDYPVSAWQEEVVNGDTRLGYRDWWINKQAVNKD